MIYRLTLYICCLSMPYYMAVAQVDTLRTYDEFQAYSGTVDSVFIMHERYFGLFIKSDCTETNHGTTFALGQGCWRRDYGNYSPRFWEIGGKASYPNPGTVYREVEAINSAAYAAWKSGGDTVEIEGIYEIDLPVWLLENNTYLGLSDSSGFRRIDPPKTRLKRKTSIGDKKIIVESTSGFRTYHQLNIANAEAYDSLAGWVAYSASIAPRIGGDTTIFLSGRSVQKAMDAGDQVSLFYPMMKGLSNAGVENVTLKNLVFDGNRDQYALNFDWRVNTTIVFPTNTASTIDHCRFYNIPSENIFLCGTKVVNSSGEGFNGSALHFSCNTIGPQTEILYNNFRMLNEVGDNIMEHSEGAFTFSSRVRNVRMSYNTLTDLGEWGIGMFSKDDLNNTITDNIISSEYTVGYRAFYPHHESNLVYNNKNRLQQYEEVDDCFVIDPKPMGVFPCNSNSTPSKPLERGDIVDISIDSLYVLNSNESYVKGISPIYDNNYFDLVGASITTPARTEYHDWSFQTLPDKEMLLFDNGHKNGLLADGNWGYELCGKPGGCTKIKLHFRVRELPEETGEVPCPLNGLKIIFDSQMKTWDQAPICTNTEKFFDQSFLGNPVLQGGSECIAPINLVNTSLSQTTADLSWDPVPEARGYLVFYKHVGAVSWKKAIVNGNDGQKSLKRLRSDQEYLWKVRARCGDKWGSFSSQQQFTTSFPDCRPVEFSNLSSFPILTDRVRLNWDAGIGSRFKIRWRLKGETRWKTRAKRGGFRYWLTKLEPGQTYEWQIQVICKVQSSWQRSSWSDLQEVSTAVNEASEPALPANHNLGAPPERPSGSDAGIELYPNPAQSEVNIVSLSGAILGIKVVQSDGKLLYDQKLKQGIFKTVLAKMPVGVHVVVVQTSQGIFYKRLIVR